MNTIVETTEKTYYYYNYYFSCVRLQELIERAPKVDQEKISIHLYI